MVRQVKAELVVEARTELGECPRWSTDEQRLSFLDIDRQQLLQLDPQRPASLERINLSSRVSAYSESENASWIAATETGFGWLDPVSGSVAEFISIIDPAIALMNDGSLDPLGRFWAGSASVDTLRKDGSLFMVDGNLEVHVMLSSVGMSNGIGFVDDGGRLLHVDTLAGTVTSYDVIERPDGPTLINSDVLVKIRSSEGLPDGLAVDELGGFWLAVWGAGEVRRYTPTGDLDTVILTGAANTTSCAFGGGDRETLFITSARQGLSSPSDLDGGLFTSSPGVKGVEQSAFAASLG